MSPFRLSILGVGLLGGSVGLAVKRHLTTCEIVGYGHSRDTLEKALRFGAVDRISSTPQQAVADADLILLATPVGVFGKILKELVAAVKPGAIVTDVGSTKRSVVEQGEHLLPAHAAFVGSHPIAGSEKRGIDFARADLLTDALCILTPTPRTPPPALEQVESFWRALGMRTTRMDPAHHDHVLADVSHLPHALAAAVVNLQAEEALGVAGRGFADSTRIAGGDPGLWRDILLDNRDAVLSSLDRLSAQVQHLRQALERGDADALERFLAAAAARRAKLPPNAGGVRRAEIGP